jgi:inosine-uridine nucleoside N-ribohydrolase
MGGVLDVPGRTVDTNFGYDPLAARIVLGSGATLLVAPLDATTQTMLTAEDLNELAAIESPIAASLARTTRPWLSYSVATRAIPGIWLHDLLVVELLANPTIATTVPAELTVDASPGPQSGRTLVLPSSWPNAAQARSTMVRDVDNDALLATMFAAFRA